MYDQDNAENTIDKSNDTLIVSSAFGTIFNTCYPAIPGTNSVFFSNNIETKIAAERNGWKFRLVARHPLDDDYKTSSIQSKYIKFLQFFDEFPELAHHEKILYLDHKFNLQRHHLTFMDSIFRTDKQILIRNTPRIKNSVSDEISDALGQERYSTSMPQTIEWIHRIANDRSLSLHNRIMNTGIIYYRQRSAVSALLVETYQTVLRLRQPECQIIWAMLSQEYEDFLQRLEWGDLNPTWQTPTQHLREH